MIWFERLRGAVRRHPLAVDCALAASIALVTVLVPQPDVLPGQVVPVGATVDAGAACVALVARRRWPRASFAVVALATAAALALAQGVAVWTIAEAVGLYTVVIATDRRTTVRAFALSTLVLVVVVVLSPIDQGPGRPSKRRQGN